MIYIVIRIRNKRNGSKVISDINLIPGDRDPVKDEDIEASPDAKKKTNSKNKKDTEEADGVGDEEDEDEENEDKQTKHNITNQVNGTLERSVS